MQIIPSLSCASEFAHYKKIAMSASVQRDETVNRSRLFVLMLIYHMCLCIFSKNNTSLHLILVVLKEDSMLYIYLPDF